MKIAVDMQALQGESKKRGIGRFTREFCRALHKHRPKDAEIVFLFNLYLSSPLLEREADLDYIGIDKSNIAFWMSTGPSHWRDSKNEANRIMSEELLAKTLEALNPDVFIVPSLFEGYFDNCVTIIPPITGCQSVVFNHDLIPLEDKNSQAIPEFQSYYQNKLNSLGRADLILTPSMWTKTKTLDALGPRFKQKIKVVGEGVSNVFLSTERTTDRLRYGPSDDFKYFLLLGIEDPRKGFLEALKSYSLLPAHLRNSTKLKVVGNNSRSLRGHVDNTLSKCSLPPSSVHLTGRVDDRVLAELYRNSVALLFLSSDEGFGLPLLEAFACKTAAIASRTGSIPEVVGTNYKYLVNRDNPQEIAAMMLDALESDAREVAIQQGQLRLSLFSWDSTAAKAWHAICDLKPASSIKVVSTNTNKPSITKAKATDNPTIDQQAFARKVACQHFLTALRRRSSPKLFIDISEIIKHDAATGVQRVTKQNIIYALSSKISMHGREYKVCFCYATTSRQGYRVAEVEVVDGIHLSYHKTEDPIDPRCGDIFFGLDLQHDVIVAQNDYLKMLYSFGVGIVFLVHDLLPITHPHFFHFNTEKLHTKWVAITSQFDGAVCVSNATATRLADYLKSKLLDSEKFKILVSPNGSDPISLVNSPSLTDTESKLMSKILSKEYLLVVGTVEPRKGIDEVIDGMISQAWSLGRMIPLVVVGKKGWMSEHTEDRICELSKRDYPLIRIPHASDALLANLYRNAMALIAGSYDEGFGLPVVEAAMFELPVIARDIPVFREVGCQSTYYVDHFNSDGFAKALNSIDTAPRSGENICLLPHLKWRESCEKTFNSAISACQRT